MLWSKPKTRIVICVSLTGDRAMLLKFYDDLHETGQTNAVLLLCGIALKCSVSSDHSEQFSLFAENKDKLWVV